ncbi:MAG: zinc ribbon domain-containing protein [Bellilinea sp.]
MNTFALVIGFALLVLSLLYVALPFRTAASAQKSSRAALKRPGVSKQALVESHQKAILALRDLDFDYRAGKVSDDDYSSLRANLIAQAAASYQRLEDMSDAKLESLIQARRKLRPADTANLQANPAPASEFKCENCQAPLVEGANFCMKCGTMVTKEFCPHCGKPVGAGDSFCPACGLVLESSPHTDKK